MKKVGIVSSVYQNVNYGGVLQGYAMAAVLRKYGMDAVQIALDFEKLPNELAETSKPNQVIQKIMRELKKGHILSRFNAQIVNIDNTIKRRAYLKQPFAAERKKAFDAFYSQQIPHSTPYGVGELDKLNTEYDVFLCGSDIIWKQTRWIPHKEYYLSFVSDNKTKIAYAPSFGVDHLYQNNYEETCRLLLRFQALSVREESGRKIIKEVSGRDAEVVADPTMLLSQNEWNKVAVPAKVKEKYAFAYLLGVRRETQVAVTQYCRIRGWKLVVIPCGSGLLNPQERGFGDIQYRSASPGEWIGLIRDAEAVFTDSFHGAVFSVIYEKELFLFKRYADSDKGSFNTRVINLVNQLGLENRLIEPDELITGTDRKINWIEVSGKMDDFAKESLEYLQTAFDCELTM